MQGRKIFAKLLIRLTVALTIPVLSAEAKDLVYVIDIKKDISPTTQLYLSGGLAEARRQNAAAVILHLNTYGGLLDAADSMRTAILYSPIPVYAFIDNNAASAGALISVACKAIYMRKGAGIGAASVVDNKGEILPDKYQSYMRAMMRATSEAHGRDSSGRWLRDPLIAEAMVDERTVVPGLVDSGRVLTLTAEEAIQWHFCEGIAETKEEVVERYLGLEDYELQTYSPSWYDDLKGFLLNPALQSILILIIIGGIYFELQTPGMGFPSMAALAAAVCYFAPLYLDGLAANWEILLFIVGLLLIAVELFVIPGTFLPGLAGILCIVTGLTTSLLDNDNFDFDGVTTPDTSRAAMTVLLGLGGGFLLMLWLSHRIGQGRGAFRRIALDTEIDTTVAEVAPEHLKGRSGTAATSLRPSGKVIIDDQYYDAISESGFIESGAPVEVTHTENTQLYVTLIPKKTC
ncbi:MAG: nodulation protein NfeD [Tannerellaceae bacterium]|jgi:membrane-bound serine protease (ClpP class)|nr:nodulation protein NfeD [Tannerellaceae bacterium]